MTGFSQRLIIFLKAPVQGQVKTRLAERIGDRRTLEAYVAMIGDLFSGLSSVFLQAEVICYVGGDAAFPFDKLFSDIPRPVYRRQEGRDLGERMYNALKNAFSDECDQAVLIGSDIPQLDADHLAVFFEKLSDYPVVLGPSDDGGYYLIGVRAGSLHPHLFQGITWSTDTVLEETLNRARDLLFSVYEGPVHRDIDTLEDLENLLSQPGAAERTPRLAALFPDLTAD